MNFRLCSVFYSQETILGIPQVLKTHYLFNILNSNSFSTLRSILDLKESLDRACHVGVLSNPLDVTLKALEHFS